MRVAYNDLNIQFSIGRIQFYAINFILEKFLRSIPAHRHSDNSYEIHYIPYGRGQVKINQVVYEVVPGTLFVTGPHVEHEQIPLKEDPMVEYCIYLKTEKIKANKKTSDSSYENQFLNTGFWFGADNQNIHAIMQQIFCELEKKYTGYMTQVKTLLQQMIVQLIRNYENQAKSTNQFEISDLSDRKYLIIEEYFLYEYRNIKLDTLSKRLALSTRQTERLLKQHYGKTFLQKSMEAKMSAASVLLLDPKNTITEISVDLGYSSAEHFSSAFKRYYSESPTRYRKKLTARKE